MADPGVAEKLGAHVKNPSEEGAEQTVVHSLGKDYPVSGLEQRLKGQLEQWLIRNAIKTITDCEAFAADETDENQKYVYQREAEKQRTMFMNARSAGSYNWMGLICRQAITDVPGTVQLLFLLLQRCDKTATQEETYRAYMANRADFNAAIFWALGKEGALVGGAAKSEAKG